MNSKENKLAALDEAIKNSLKAAANVGCLLVEHNMFKEAVATCLLDHTVTLKDLKLRFPHLTWPSHSTLTDWVSKKRLGGEFKIVRRSSGLQKKEQVAATALNEMSEVSIPAPLEPPLKKQRKPTAESTILKLGDAKNIHEVVHIFFSTKVRGVVHAPVTRFQQGLLSKLDFEGLVAHLKADGYCPWQVKLSHQSIVLLQKAVDVNSIAKTFAGKPGRDISPEAIPASVWRQLITEQFVVLLCSAASTWTFPSLTSATTVHMSVGDKPQPLHRDNHPGLPPSFVLAFNVNREPLGSKILKGSHLMESLNAGDVDPHDPRFMTIDGSAGIFNSTCVHGSGEGYSNERRSGIPANVYRYFMTLSFITNCTDGELKALMGDSIGGIKKTFTLEELLNLEM